MGALAHDILSLAEMQLELFRVDCREGIRRILLPVALLLFAGIVAVGTVPIALILVAEFLVQSAGLSRAAAFSIAAMSGFIVAVAATLARVRMKSNSHKTSSTNWGAISGVKKFRYNRSRKAAGGRSGSHEYVR